MAAKLPGLSPRHCQALDTSIPLSSSIFPGQADPPAALVLCSELTSILYRLSLPLIPLWKLLCIFPESSECETSPNPTPGRVMLPLPTKVHELCFIHSSLLAFPIEIGPFGPVFVDTCLCASCLLLSRHTHCRFNKP